MYKESWGELLTTKVHSVVCVLDIETWLVTTLGSIPNGVSPGQVRFSLTQGSYTPGNTWKILEFDN